MNKYVDFRPIELKDALAVVVGTVAVIIGLIQYHYTSRNEFLKPIRETQLKLYVDASSAAASIATLPQNSKEWNTARSDFLRLYYGPLAIVESYKHRKQRGDGGYPQFMLKTDRSRSSMNCVLLAFERFAPHSGGLPPAKIAVRYRSQSNCRISWIFNCAGS
jgi:hypothetical protein